VLIWISFFFFFSVLINLNDCF